MERDFLGGIVRQEHLTGYFCENDLTIIANKYRKNIGLPEGKFKKYKEAKKTQEFLHSLMKSEDIADVIKAKRGRGSTTWVHPMVFFDYAMWLNPDFKVKVYKWLYDNLTVFRDDSGESYKIMAGVLADTHKLSPAQAGIAIPQLARNIKRLVGVSDWNKAEPAQLKKRDELHKNITMLLKAGVEINRAFEVAKQG